MSEKQQPEIKYMSLKEFRDRGLLQEINRQFLHPLGLAFAVGVSNETDDVIFGGIWDYRDKPGGILFDEKLSLNHRAEQYVSELRLKNQEKRKNRFGGSIIQPLK